MAERRQTRQRVAGASKSVLDTSYINILDKKLQKLNDYEAFYGIDPDKYPEAHEKGLAMEYGTSASNNAIPINKAQPERPWFRMSLHDAPYLVKHSVSRLIKGELKSNQSKAGGATHAFKEIGNMMAENMKNQLQDSKIPKLAKRTVLAKGHDVVGDGTDRTDRKKKKRRKASETMLKAVKGGSRKR